MLAKVAELPARGFIYLDWFEELAAHFNEHLDWEPGPDRERHFPDTAEMMYSDESICRETCKHVIVDCSSAGPDSGNMDQECIRCGQYWSIPLY